MRVVSLLPAATEIVAALGRIDDLAAVSHECDFPPAVAAKPRATRCEIHGNALPSGEIDAWVRRSLHETGTLYTIDEPLLREIAPDVILSQRLCDVCAVAWGSVVKLAETLPGPPAVVNLEPMRLGDVFQDVLNVGAAIGASAEAVEVVGELQERTNVVRRRAATLARRRCVLLDWLDPLYRSGHWGPDLVTTAGGVDPIGVAGTDAATVPWETVRAAAPEVIVVACCGFDIERTLRDLPPLRELPGWSDLPAVRQGAVWVLDGNAYVSRPGPRLVDSLEILAQCIHPEAFGTPDPECAVRVG